MSRESSWSFVKLGREHKSALERSKQMWDVLHEECLQNMAGNLLPSSSITDVGTMKGKGWVQEKLIMETRREQP